MGGLRMRGFDRRRDTLFSYVRTDDRIPKAHPLRVIREVANEALRSLSDQLDELYAAEGRPSIPPEQLLRRCCCKPSTRSARSVS